VDGQNGPYLEDFKVEPTHIGLSWWLIVACTVSEA
jgi:hypothetical protein